MAIDDDCTSGLLVLSSRKKKSSVGVGTGTGTGVGVGVGVDGANFCCPSGTVLLVGVPAGHAMVSGSVAVALVHQWQKQARPDRRSPLPRP